MFTTNNFTSYVNIALNYPAVSFDDIRLFLDQAISEINTELHTSILSIHEMEDKAKENSEDLPNFIVLTEAEITQGTIPVLSSPPSGAVKPRFYYDSTASKYGLLKDGEYTYYDMLYGVYLLNGVPTYYRSGSVLSSSIKAWYKDDLENPSLVDLENYFTMDWIKLFLVPYVCFKYSVRDGDTGRLFNEEFSQGFQQLRHSYNVTFTVNLARVADKFAYKDDVEKYLPNLNREVPTKAITNEMKNPQGVNATYRDFYDVGGFGL